MLLNTDKPLYKPGQKVHIRALVMKQPIPSAMIELGLPPGFEVDLTELTSAKTNGVVNVVERKGPRLVLYLGDVGPTPQKVTVDARAKLPLEAKAPASAAYPYYAPEYLTLVETPTVTVTAR